MRELPKLVIDILLPKSKIPHEWDSRDPKPATKTETVAAIWRDPEKDRDLLERLQQDFGFLQSEFRDYAFDRFFKKAHASIYGKHRKNAGFRKRVETLARSAPGWVVHPLIPFEAGGDTRFGNMALMTEEDQWHALESFDRRGNRAPEFDIERPLYPILLPRYQGKVCLPLLNDYGVPYLLVLPLDRYSGEELKAAGFVSLRKEITLHRKATDKHDKETAKLGKPVIPAEEVLAAETDFKRQGAVANKPNRKNQETRNFGGGKAVAELPDIEEKTVPAHVTRMEELTVIAAMELNAQESGISVVKHRLKKSERQKIEEIKRDMRKGTRRVRDTRMHDALAVLKEAMRLEKKQAKKRKKKAKKERALLKEAADVAKKEKKVKKKKVKRGVEKDIRRPTPPPPADPLYADMLKHFAAVAGMLTEWRATQTKANGLRRDFDEQRARLLGTKPKLTRRIRETELDFMQRVIDRAKNVVEDARNATTKWSVSQKAADAFEEKFKGRMAQARTILNHLHRKKSPLAANADKLYARHLCGGISIIEGKEKANIQSEKRAKNIAIQEERLTALMKQKAASLRTKAANDNSQTAAPVSDQGKPAVGGSITLRTRVAGKPNPLPRKIQDGAAPRRPWHAAKLVMTPTRS